ncbi:MAG: hypothetical protein KA711_10150 [Ideonella sp. WA131b]|nr:hypothetical protein [Ideonella sp. WA131b]
MTRPLMQRGIDQLEALFKVSKGDLVWLRQLEDELKQRQVPRAVALLEKVQAAMATLNSQAPKVSSAPPAPRETGPAAQPDLWERPDVPAPVVPLAVAPKPPPPPVSVAPRPAPSPPAAAPQPAPQPMPAMSMEEACKVLAVTLATPWQEVESARRKLVDISHQERLAAVPSERKDQMRFVAKRANAAYLVLSASKLR